MSSVRYNKTKIIVNEDEYYEPLRKRHDNKKVRHYATPSMYFPTGEEMATTMSTKHVWKYGDRFYNLAHQYYNDVRFWWVIAWWNRYPTEATIPTGTVLYVPLNLAEALKVLKV